MMRTTRLILGMAAALAAAPALHAQSQKTELTLVVVDERGNEIRREDPRNNSRNNTSSENDKIFVEVEEPAKFPGGQNGLLRYLAANLQYPTAAQENNVQGRVIVKFIVEKDGRVTNAQIVKSVDPELDREALRVVRRIIGFTPGRSNGEPVRTYFTLPVTFKLTEQ